MRLDFIQWYLIIINIVSLILFTVDFQMYVRTGKGIHPESLCDLVTMIGGALGTNIAFLIWDRSLNKKNLTWRVYAFCMLVLQVVLYLVFYGKNNELARAWVQDYISRHTILCGYLMIVNIITFILFIVDKIKAMMGKWRIRILVLLGFCLIGGSIGGLLAMYASNHKTSDKTAYFSIGVPLMIIVQFIVLWYCTVYLGM